MLEIKDNTQKEDDNEEEEEDIRNNLNIQQFMNDMKILGDQIRDKDLDKPAFNYGQLEITNYLLWLMLGELMIFNNKMEEED